MQVIHDVEDFLGVELARKIHVSRDRVTMLAAQIAASDEVPDNHRAWRVAAWTDRCRVPDFLKKLAQAKHDALPVGRVGLCGLASGATRFF